MRHQKSCHSKMFTLTATYEMINYSEFMFIFFLLVYILSFSKLVMLALFSFFFDKKPLHISNCFGLLYKSILNAWKHAFSVIGKRFIIQ